MGDVRVIHGDCLDVLPTLAGEPIVAVIADPPYGINLSSRNGGSRSKAALALDDYRVEGDCRPFDPAPWLAFPKVILWGANHYADRLPPRRSWLVWDKREGGTSDDQADCELAWTNLPGPERLFSHRWRGMIKASERSQKRVHPTQKPVALIAWCIKQLGLQPGDLVLDPYAGSGTTGLACLNAGLRCILIEKESRYIPVIGRRLDLARTPLFDETGMSPPECSSERRMAFPWTPPLAEAPR
jgi:site-specific DNA-methyltransferase (adenine-specific)